MERSKQIIRTSILGIFVNLVLVSFKAIVGIASGSIAIILDAVNNLSDALSSVITIIGTKLAGKKPDQKHPYGHGRIEYLTGLLIALIVLIAGFTSIRESIEKIITPAVTNHGVLSVVVMAVAILAKFALGTYVRRVGKKLHSGSLEASGIDAFFDAILSIGTLIAILLNLKFGWNLEGWIGAVISIVILKAGIEILIKMAGSLIGTRADPELAEALKKRIATHEGVRGVFDLTLHNYGPTQIIGSVHIEVDDNMTAREIHRLTRNITVDVYHAFGIILTVGIYASNSITPEIQQIRESLMYLVAGNPEILELHGFYADQEMHTVTFDLVVDFKADGVAVRDSICREISKQYPEYHFSAILDSDYA